MRWGWNGSRVMVGRNCYEGEGSITLGVWWRVAAYG